MSYQNYNSTSDKQELLNSILKRREFSHLYIKLCSTRDIEWINILNSVTNKIEHHDLGNKKDLKVWITNECKSYIDIRDAAISYISNTSIFRCCF